MAKKFILAHNEFLNNYVLGMELAKNAGISSNAYLFWKNLIYCKFPNSRIVFLQKNTIPEKYKNIEHTNLNGLVLASSFCNFSGLSSSHLTKSNYSKIYNLIELREICNIKFINLKKFYDDFKIDYSSKIYIEKCKFFSQNEFERKIKITDSLCLGYY